MSQEPGLDPILDLLLLVQDGGVRLAVRVNDANGHPFGMVVKEDGKKACGRAQLILCLCRDWVWLKRNQKGIVFVNITEGGKQEIKNRRRKLQALIPDHAEAMITKAFSEEEA